MNQQKPITPFELSQYYDDLLAGPERQRVEQALQNDPQLRQTLERYDLYQHVQCRLPEEEADRLLQNNLSEIHQRIVAQPPQRSSEGWSWLFSPRVLAYACIMLLIFTAALSQMPDPSNPGAERSLAQRSGERWMEESAPPMTELQKQTMLAITGYATSALNQGIEYASEKTETFREAFQDSEEPNLARSGLNAPFAPETRTGPQNEAAATDGQAPGESEAGAWGMIQMGLNQVVLGISASFFMLLSVL